MYLGTAHKEAEKSKALLEESSTTLNSQNSIDAMKKQNSFKRFKCTD